MRQPDQGTDAPTVAESVVSAGEMAQALNAVATKLLEMDIITSAGFAAMLAEVSRLRRNPAATSWELEIDRDNPVVFSELLDHDGEIISPRITCAGIKVAQQGQNRPPFTAMDIALEVEDSHRAPVSRWHVDWANETDGLSQPGSPDLCRR